MRFKHKDIEIPEGNPFANCKLDRRQFADILTNMVAYAEDGFTMALTGKWGSGKTTFVKMWKQMLADQGYKTFYLNAWSSDFVEDPLIAIFNGLLSCLPSSNKDKAHKAVKELCSSLRSLERWGTLLLGVAKGVSSTFVGEQTADAAAEFLGAKKSLCDDELAKLVDYQSTIDGFKNSIQDLVLTDSDGKPVIVIVDELDRCKPDYAILYLERIKHFFDIDGVIFVLTLDKKQFFATVKGYYGSELIDSEEYLRRFIDVEYVLPDPDVRTYCKYMYDYYGFEKIFNSGRTHGHLHAHDIQNAGYYYRDIFIKIAECEKLTLRQIEKYFTQSYLACSARAVDQTNYIVALLVYLKMFKPDTYEMLKSDRYSAQNIMDELCMVFIEELRSERSQQYSTVANEICALIHLYNNSKPYDSQESLLVRQGEQDVATVRHKLLNEEAVNRAMKGLHGSLEWSNRVLEQYFPVVDMTTHMGLE